MQTTSVKRIKIILSEGSRKGKTMLKLNSYNFKELND